MWYDGLKAIFTGPEDGDYCVLKFVTERYSLFVDCKEIKGAMNNRGVSPAVSTKFSVI
jgi:general stress protein 26